MIALGLLLTTACDPKTFDPVLSLGNIQSAAITSPTAGTAIVITEADADKVATFQWSAADYGFQAAVTYSLQADLEGGDFSDPIGLATTNGTSVDLVYADLNAALLSANVPDGVASNMMFRVVSDINDDVAEAASEAVMLSITPYKTVVAFPQLAVPGAHQGWNANDSVNAVFDRGFNGNYEGFVYFAGTGNEFKFSDPGRGWDLNWGDDGADGSLEENGANIIAPDEGMYRLKVNLNDFSYTSEAANFGLIGDATGSWDNDQDLVWNETTRAMELTLDLVVGAVKFRANDDWALNFGDNAANGSLEYDGENIAIAEAGNYTIQLFISGPEYTYTLTKN